SATTTYNFNSGMMSPNAAGLFSLGSLLGSGTLNTASGQNFSLGLLGASTTFSGIISGAGFIVKEGIGTLTLTGANTYTGGTTISNGMLMVNNMSGSGTGAGAVMVNPGGTLGGSGVVSGAVTVSSGGSLVPGNPLGALTVSNNLAFAAGSTTLI